MTTETPVQRALNALVDAGCGPRRSGGGWQARCPAHEDSNPSLSVNEADDGRVLLHCHTGCDLASVLVAAKLTTADLFPEPNGEKARGSREMVGAYRYVDEDGHLLFEVVRFQPKDFRQRRPDGNGGWIWNLDDTRRVLYRLPLLLAARAAAGELVFVVEGEKDVHAVETAGHVATCNPGGASKSTSKSKWRPEYSEALRGADVIIVADTDDAGHAHARHIAKSLDGVAARVRTVEALKGKDVSDHLAAGHTLEELVPVDLDAPSPNGPAAPAGAEAAGTTATRIADVFVERIRWLWPARLPFAKVSLLDGDPGLGKSTLTLDIAARVSTASPMPDGHRPDHPGNVLVISAEDGAADTIRPRLEAAGADLERIWVFDRVEDYDEKADLYFTRPIELPGDLLRIEGIVRDHDITLVIIDPLVAFLGAKTDSHRDSDVRRVLYPLAQMAQATGAAVLCLRHLNKAPGTNPIYRGGGSIGFIGAARLGLLVAAHPDDPERRVLAVAKSNLAAIPESLVFRLCPDDLRQVAYVGWQEGECALRASDLLGGSPRERAAPQRDRAQELLQEVLADGPVLRSEIVDQAEAEDISWRTVMTAKKALGVRSKQVAVPGQQGAGPSWWYLPSHYDPMNGVQDPVSQSDCTPFIPCPPEGKSAGAV